MTFVFRPAERSQAKPLIGLYSESGAGKTWSSLLLSRGFVGPSGKIGMIETEAGRGEAYADVLPGGYQVLSLRETFSPKNYGEAITAAEQAKLDALIIDSASHEWEGAGGVLAMAAQNQADGKKGPLVWQMPKLDHQRHFMLRLLATPIPLVIVCMRAKYPMHEVKQANGHKEWQRSDVLEPKQSEDILFEMFVHGWIDRQHQFHGTKYTRDDLKQIIRDCEPISIKTGERLATWARGGTASAAGNTATAEATMGEGIASVEAADLISFDKAKELALEFGLALKVEYREPKKVVAILDKWMRKEQLFDSAGKPTLAVILKKNLYDMRAAALEFATAYSE